LLHVIAHVICGDSFTLKLSGVYIHLE
jgi:hypothetical protein